MAQLFFWCGVLLLLHTYFFYPFLLFVLDGLDQVRANVRYMRGGLDRRHRAESPVPPRVSLVIAAYNEASCIADKIRNSLALDYPADRLEVLVGSDGSTDGTNEIVRSFSDPRVRLVAGTRGGKVSVLNRCIPAAAGEIVVLSDANTEIDTAALKKLVRHFDDPDVGAVCGKLRLYNPTRNDFEESSYWAYESLIKLYEGKRGAVVGANGGLYAIRRALFAQLPPGTICDDFVIPMRILDSGFRVVYEPAAWAQEETTEDYGLEFGRRTRIAAGNFQSLKLVAGLLSPMAGFRAFAFWSHKVLRWVAPALMGLVLATNVFLLDSLLYRIILGAQLAFYALALAGRMNWFRGRLRKACSVAYYFTTMNLALAVGFWRFLRHSQRAAWDRTARA